MQVKEIEAFGYPIALRHPKWPADSYFVMRSLTSLEFWEKGERVKDPPGTWGREMEITTLFYFHWFEDERWEPMFGFY